MKSLFLSSILLSSTISGAIITPELLHKRMAQLPDLTALMGSATKPAVVLDQKPQLRPNAKRQILRFGPFTLPPLKDKSAQPEGEAHSHNDKRASNPLKMDPNGFTIMKTITGFCTDCTVLSEKTDVVFTNGTRASIAGGVYLHHVVAMDLSKKADAMTTNCPEDYKEGKALKGLPVSGFLGGAVDEFTQYFTTPDGKFESGYMLGSKDKFAMMGEVINYRPEPQDIYVQFDLEWVDGKVGANIEKQTLSATGCMVSADGAKFGDGSPKGVVKSKGFPIYKDGHLLSMRGHMHDGGEAVTMYLNDKEICSSKAEYGGAGGTMKSGEKEWTTISRMSDCLEPIAVKKGDYLRLEASYDTVKHPLRKSEGEAQEGMGMMYFNFAAV